MLGLLRHFEDVGFDGAPRVVGDGLDAAGRELLTYLPGSSPHPYAWPDPAMPVLGELLRRAHGAGRGFVPAAEPGWRPWFGRGLLGDDPVIGHGDPGPWNVVAGGDGLPYALIDWEFAGPVDAVWELAHAAWLNATPSCTTTTLPRSWVCRRRQLARRRSRCCWTATAYPPRTVPGSWTR